MLDDSVIALCFLFLPPVFEYNAITISLVGVRVDFHSFAMILK